MKNTGGGGNKGSKGSSSSSPRAGGGRKSGSGMNGTPKKGGHGGKFTWSGDNGYSTAELGFDKDAKIDSKDPNYEENDHVVVIN